MKKSVLAAITIIVIISIIWLLAGCNNPTGGGGNAPGGSSGLSIEWAKCYGGGSYEAAYDLIQTADGGDIVVGLSWSSMEGDVGTSHGGGDCWLIKLNANASLEWQNCLGGSKSESIKSICEAQGGGYIIAGSTNSNNGDISGNHSSDDDIWVAKISSNGTLESQKCYGGTGLEWINSMIPMSGGGYVLAGYTTSNNGDVGGLHGGSSAADAWIVKLDSTATNIVWQKSLGGTNEERAQGIQQTSDGGYIVAGATYSNDGDVSGMKGLCDAWIVKLNSSGTLEWQKCYGGTNADYAEDIQQTSDGGYIVAGATYSNDGDVSGNYGFYDGWLIKLSSSGTLEWQSRLGGSGWDFFYSVRQTSDGGYLLTGSTDSTDHDVKDNHGGYDIWIVKINSSGALEWQKCIGGSGDDVARKIKNMPDGSYLAVGSTYTNNDGDVSGYHGSGDFYVVKLK